MDLLPYAKVGKAITTLNGMIIFGFSASLVLIPQAHFWFGLMALMLAMFACAVMVFYKKYPLTLTSGDYPLIGALLLFGGLWWWSVAASGSVPYIAEEGTSYLFYWPLVAAFLLVSLRTFTPAPQWLWLGVCCGAFGAGLIAIYERAIVGLERADNGINAIPFGNLSLLMGALSFIAAIYFIQQPKRSYYWLAGFAVSAAFLGFLASLLSGTRGGWVAIPFIVALLLQATNNLVPAKVRNAGILVSVVFLVAIILYPPSGIWLRLVAIFDDLSQYFIYDQADTSLGMRFELWRAGWYMFLDSPFMGVGEGGVQVWLNALASEGVLYERVMIHPQLHSDIIDTFARRGVLGAISLLLVYMAFAAAFTKKLLTAQGVLQVRLLAISGIMMVIAFFDFGLSQAMFRDLRGLSGFLGLSVAIWGCLGKPLPSPLLHDQSYSKPSFPNQSFPASSSPP